MSAYLDPTRNARSCARQIRSKARAGVLTPRELDRLLSKIEDDLETIEAVLTPTPPPILEGRFEVLDGGRS
ncbi:MAG: hypothetical protein ACK4YQ_16850 [Phenylobacterium sp.]|uniref:hypothetical protein n=1 Tax=Phenylobacterium sp. TaxID=1871053 RepID=UPI00391CEF42